MIIADIVKALRAHNYEVDTMFVNREAANHISVVLAGFDPNLETEYSYLPEVEVNIVFYMIDGDEIITRLKDIIKIVHEDVILTNYHHFSFTDININPTNNDVKVTMIIKYKELINVTNGA
jgi:predicted ester cyclase